MNIVSPSELDTSNPGTWPIYYKILVWVVIAAAIIGIYIYALRNDIIDQQNANQEEINKLQDEYARLYKDTLNLKKYQDRNAELVNLLKKKLEYLPNNSEIPAMIDSVYDAAVANNINFDRLYPVNDVKEEYYDIKPIILQGATGYNNFAGFAQAISSVQRILNISDITISMEKSAQNLEVTGMLQTYVYTVDLEELLKGDGSSAKKGDKKWNL